MSEDAALLLNVRTTPPRQPNSFQPARQKPAIVMKNFIVGHIIMFPLMMFYIAIFYTVFFVSFHKCHYKGLKTPLVCFIASDFFLIVALVMNLVSMMKRLLILFGNALIIVSSSILVKLVGTFWFWRTAEECFSAQGSILKLCVFSLVFCGGIWFGLYYLYLRINRKPWKEIFLKE